MAKKINITAVCDNKTLHGDREVPADFEHVLSLDGIERQVDVCEQCEGTGIIYGLNSLLTNGAVVEHGDKPRRTSRGQNLPTVCPLDGTVSKSRAGLGQHLKAHHNQRFSQFPGQLKTVADYEGLAYGPTKG